MLPIPKHLKQILKVNEQNNTEFEVTGKIVCNCGCENFTIKYVGDNSFYKTENVIKVIEIEGNYYLIITVECEKCKSLHLIFDNDFHGWNGFVCGELSKELERPKTKNWKCIKCENSNHKVIVKINSAGKEDFIEETEGDFDENDWIEAFSWITISTECESCSEKNKEWISYETM